MTRARQRAAAYDWIKVAEESVESPPGQGGMAGPLAFPPSAD